MARTKSPNASSSKSSSSSSPAPSDASNNGLGDLGILAMRPKDNTPHELDKNHQAFLSRSLSRCDKELAALHKLNQSLRSLRDLISETYGENALLDLGEGLVRLNPNASRYNNTETIPPATESALVSPTNSVPSSSSSTTSETKTKTTADGEERVLNGKHNVKTETEDTVNNNSKDDDATSPPAVPIVSSSSSAISPQQPTSTTTSPPTNTSTTNHPQNPPPLVIGTFSPSELEHDSQYQLLARDFLLRSKLRIKLLNRLARRLMRLGHAMDGNVSSVLPPPTPKYGDERFPKIDMQDEQLKKNLEVRLQQKEALKRVLDRRKKAVDVGVANNNNQEGEIKKEESQKAQQIESISSMPNHLLIEKYDPLLLDEEHQNDLNILATYDEDYSKVLTITNTTTKNASKKEDAKNQKIESSEDTATFTNKPNENKLHITKETFFLTEEQLQSLDKSEDDFDPPSSGQPPPYGIGATVRNMSSYEKVNEWKRWQNDLLGRIPHQPSFMDIEDSSKQVFALEERRAGKRKRKIQPKQSEERHNSVLDTSKVKEEQNDDIPKLNDTDDPMEIDTEVDKGDDSDAKGKSDHEKETSKQKDDSISDSDSSSTDTEMEEGKESIKDDSNDKESGIEENDSDNASQSEKYDKDKEVEAPIKKHRPFSLQPVPTFHEQDYHRTLLIHNDAQFISIHTQGKARIAEATEDYNKAFRASNDLVKKKNYLEQKMNDTIYRKRLEVNKTRNDHALEVAIAKAKWQREKSAYENKQHNRMKSEMHMYGKRLNSSIIQAMRMNDKDVAKRSLSSIIDRVVIRKSPMEYAKGTPTTMNAASRRSHTLSSVGATMSHMVDTVVKRVESHWISDRSLDLGQARRFPDFISPPRQETQPVSNNSVNKEQEASLSRDLKYTDQKLRAAERERSAAWTRLMKAKQDFDANNPSATTGRSRQGGNRLDMSRIPVPPLKGTSTSRASHGNHAGRQHASSSHKQVFDEGASAMIRNLPPPPAETLPHKIPGSHPSKYTADKVRARIYSDGSVMPVSQPKKGKDGYYLRPAGRQRKGMDWHARRGIWVPAADPANPTVIRD